MVNKIFKKHIKSHSKIRTVDASHLTSVQWFYGRVSPIGMCSIVITLPVRPSVCLSVYLSISSIFNNDHKSGVFPNFASFLVFNIPFRHRLLKPVERESLASRTALYCKDKRVPRIFRMIIVILDSITIKRNRKISDSVLWRKHLHQQKIQKNTRKKGRDLTQSYDKSPYTHRKKSKKQHDNIKNATKKTSITQRLQTDSGRSLWVTTAIQLGTQPSH